jgi:hypothetical protein
MHKLFRITLNVNNNDTFTINAENIYEAMEYMVRVLLVHPRVIDKIEEVKE